jgi:hypothetical protein
MNFSAPPSLDLYDGEACTIGGADTSAAVIPVPASAGGGSLGITRDGSTLTFSGSGLANQTTAISVELFHEYSFLVPGTSATLVTKDLRVAGSDGVLLSGPNASVSATIHADVPLRKGRFELRATFQSGAGISVSQTEVLLDGSAGWVWLGGCQSTPVAGDQFGLRSPLASDPSNWPREVYLLFRSFGVEGWARAGVGVDISAVGFVGEPWGVRPDGYDVAVTGSSGVESTSVANGTIYLIDGSTGGTLSYSVGLGNQSFFTGEAYPQPFTFLRVPLNLSRLIVQYRSGGTSVAGGEVQVSNSRGPLSRERTGRDGSATFYLPSGSYNVTASNGNETVKGSADLLPGQSLTLTLGTSPPQDETGLVVTALFATALVGLALNILVYLRGREWNFGARSIRVSSLRNSSTSRSLRSCWPQASQP